jgi:hypothetical protein
MKTCAYCGKENEDAAEVCAGCHTNEFKKPTDSPVKQHDAKDAPADIRLRDVLTDPTRLFRALVVLSTATYAIWYFQLLLAGRFISERTWDALLWQSFGALLPTPPPMLGWLLLLLSVALAVGLWMFSKSARMVYAALCAFWIATSPLGGVQVNTAFGSFLLLLSNMSAGALLVMAYTSPLKERFE